MQCTPESNVYLESCKGQSCDGDCSDSGYSGVFHTPQSVRGLDSCRSLSPVEFSETPKENIWLSVTPKESTWEAAGCVGKDPRGVHQRPAAVGWCETPRAHRRDAPMRQRLLMCKPAADVKTEHARSPRGRRAESEHWLGASFDSLDALKLERDLLLSGRKRRLLFTQARTSTLENGKLDSSAHLSSFERKASLLDVDFGDCDQIDIRTPCFIKSLPAPPQETPPSPDSGVTHGLYDVSSVLCTPSSRTPKYLRCVLLLTPCEFDKCSCVFYSPPSNPGSGLCVKTAASVP